MIRAMPPEAPLAMAPQDFADCPQPRHVRARRHPATILWRVGAFGPAVLLTVSLIDGLLNWFSSGGVTAGEAVAVILIGITFIWVSLTVSAVLIALLRLALAPPRPARAAQGRERVALLVPIHNENPAEVMGNVAAMRAELARGRGAERFAFFILSDTRDEAVACAEARAYRHLATEDGIPVYYRRRAENTDRKTGNINDWITRWGGDWDAMIVLDADSLMSGAAIRALADAMEADPEAGLIQSFPVLISAETLFGRMQEFATSVYGWLLAEGLALWSGSEGNYWGHNAIIRTRAFAESAHLPKIGRDRLILSHDFRRGRHAAPRRLGGAVRRAAQWLLRGDAADADRLHPARPALVPGQHAASAAPWHSRVPPDLAVSPAAGGRVLPAVTGVVRAVGGLVGLHADGGRAQRVISAPPTRSTPSGPR